jgi:CRP/FNR family transcriptional regulator, cyclic AMP receptor protein
MSTPALSLDQIRSVPLFNGIPDEMLDEIVEVSTVTEFPRQGVICHEHDNGTSLFVILEGLVKVSLVRGDGKEAILDLLSPGNFFGEMALLDNRPRSASVIAMKSTKVIILTRADFMELVCNRPQIMNNMIVAIASRLRKANQKIANLAFLDAIGRVSDVLLGIAEEHGEEADEGIIVRNRPPHEQLGNMAATTRETVTHCLATLEKRGYVLSNGRDLIIYSLDDLKRDFIAPVVH